MNKKVVKKNSIKGLPWCPCTRSADLRSLLGSSSPLGGDRGESSGTKCFL